MRASQDIVLERS